MVFSFISLIARYLFAAPNFRDTPSLVWERPEAHVLQQQRLTQLWQEFCLWLSSASARDFDRKPSNQKPKLLRFVDPGCWELLKSLSRQHGALLGRR